MPDFIDDICLLSDGHGDDLVASSFITDIIDEEDLENAGATNMDDER